MDLAKGEGFRDPSILLKGPVENDKFYLSTMCF